MNLWYTEKPFGYTTSSRSKQWRFGCDTQICPWVGPTCLSRDASTIDPMGRHAQVRVGVRPWWCRCMARVGSWPQRGRLAALVAATQGRGGRADMMVVEHRRDGHVRPLLIGMVAGRRGAATHDWQRRAGSCTVEEERRSRPWSWRKEKNRDGGRGRKIETKRWRVICGSGR